LVYNFADGGEGGGFKPAMFWFARHLNQPNLLAPELPGLQRILAQPADAVGRAGFLPLVALWWSTVPTTGAAPPLPLAWFGDGPNPIGIFRSSWTDTNALYLAFKGGSARLNHAHMDAGSFVLEADGVRWARDLGAQDYHSIESKGWSLWDRGQDGQRWKIFRLNNFSHNTLTIDGQLHRANGDARITHFDPETRRATVDLTGIFKDQATRVVRQFGIGDHREVTVTDELQGLKPGAEVRWQLVTRAEVEVQPAEAILRQDGKTLQARVHSPAEARFAVRPADPPADGVNTPNPGSRILTLDARAPSDGRMRITVSLRPGPAESGTRRP
jgi:hypothetical protein